MTIASFIPSVTGLDAMSHAQQTVAENISNMNTTGYKQNETLFQTLLGSSGWNVGAQSGLHSSRTSILGVGTHDRTNISMEGLVKPTGNTFDVALSGNSNAFFQLDDGYGTLYYSRAGDFTRSVQDGQVYLLSSGGLHVQGFKSVDGTDNFNTSPENIVIEAPQSIPQKETTEASIVANVPANDVDSSTYGFRIYSENYDGANLNMILKKIDGRENAWNLSFGMVEGTATSDVAEIVFNTDGTIKSPEKATASITWNDGSTSSVTIDLSKLTQYAGSSQITYIDQNGYESGNMISLGFDENGILRANYSNGHTHTITKLAVVGFTAPEQLLPYNTTLFEATGEVGNSFYVDTTNLIAPESVESSTVDLAEQFSKMIVVQRAYSLNAQSFTVNDEMLSLLVDLKS